MGSTRVGAIRSSQVITTYGPGAMVDLPKHSVIVAGLDTWRPKHLRLIVEPPLTEKIRPMTGISAHLCSPPPERSAPWGGAGSGTGHIGVRRFPEWFVVQRPDEGCESASSESSGISRRLVHVAELEKGLFEKQPVVATRFVRACPKGHVDDLDWRHFVHSGHTSCRQQLWLDERGQSGDLSDLVVRCQCGQQRPLSKAGEWNEKPLGNCSGNRPWLGKYARQDCDQPSRLLIRTASNAYFSQVVRVLSIPDSDTAVQEAIEKNWSTIFQAIQTKDQLEDFGPIPAVKSVRDAHDDDAILKAIATRRTGEPDSRPAKQVELDAFLAAPEGFGDDVPVNPDYHARRLAKNHWKYGDSPDGIDAVVQLHRLREVSALVGFTRLDAALPDIDGEYDTDVTRADLDENPSWFPAVENRGEGIFLSLRSDTVANWLERPDVQRRVDKLQRGHARWLQRRKKEKPEFPGGPYILVHTLAHLLMQALALRCGYPATSIRERIYIDPIQHRYGLLLYTASPDADGTLGGLVEQARHIVEHLSVALKMAELCSSDPICA